MLLQRPPCSAGGRNWTCSRTSPAGRTAKTCCITKSWKAIKQWRWGTVGY